MTFNKSLVRIGVMIVLAVSLLLAMTAITGIQVAADHTPEHAAACDGIRATGGTCDAAVDEGSLTGIISDVVNILTILVGALSIIMIIIGGIRYIVSAGDAGKVASAKNTILYAVIGLIIAMSANIIVNFVINKT